MSFEQDPKGSQLPGPTGTLSVKQYTDLIDSYTSVLDPKRGDLISACPSIKVLSLRIKDTKDPDPLMYFYIDTEIDDIQKVILSLHLVTLQNLWRALKAVFHRTLVGVPILPPEISSKFYLSSRFMKGIVLYLTALLRRLLSHSIIKRHQLMVQLFTRPEHEVSSTLYKLANPDIMHGHASSDDLLYNIMSQAHGHLHGHLHSAGLVAALNLPLMYNLTLDDAAYLKTGHYSHNLMKLIADHTITKSTLAAFKAKLKISATYLEAIDQSLDMPKGDALREFLYGPLSTDDLNSLNFARTIRGILLKRHLIFEENLKSVHSNIKQISSAIAEIIDAESNISHSMATLADSLTLLFVSETKFDGVLAGPATNAVAACVNPPNQSDFLHSQIANQLRADVYPRIAASLDIISSMAKLTIMRYDYLVVCEFLASLLKKKISDVNYLKIPQEIMNEVVLISKSLVKRQMDAIEALELHKVLCGVYKEDEKRVYLNIAHEGDRVEISSALKAIDDEATASFNALCSKAALSKAQIELLDSFRCLHTAFIENIMYLFILESRFVYEYLFSKCIVTELIVHSMGRLSAIFGRTIHVESNLWESSDEWIRTTRGQKTPWYKIIELGQERYELDVDLQKLQE